MRGSTGSRSTWPISIMNSGSHCPDSRRVAKVDASLLLPIGLINSIFRLRGILRWIMGISSTWASRLGFMQFRKQRNSTMMILPIRATIPTHSHLPLLKRSQLIYRKRRKSLKRKHWRRLSKNRRRIRGTLSKRKCKNLIKKLSK